MRWGEILWGPRLAQAEDSTLALGRHDVLAYTAGVPRPRRRGVTDRR